VLMNIDINMDISLIHTNPTKTILQLLTMKFG